MDMIQIGSIVTKQISSRILSRVALIGDVKKRRRKRERPPPPPPLLIQNVGYNARYGIAADELVVI